MSENNFRKIACCENCKHLVKRDVADVIGSSFMIFRPTCELNEDVIFYDIVKPKTHLHVCDKFEESEKGL